MASGGHFPPGGPGSASQRINLYQNWPLEGVSRQVARGSPASLQIYTKSGLWRPFPSKWPWERPPAYKCISKLASGGRFPAGGPGKPRQRTNLYEKWPLETISQPMAQGAPSSVYYVYILEKHINTTSRDLAINFHRIQTIVATPVDNIFR